jgi:hypothetical protein
MAEEKLVALHRVNRLCFIMKPTSWSGGRDPKTCQLSHRAHVVAFPNTGADKVRDCLLSPLAKADISVIFLVMVATPDPEERLAILQKMAKKAHAIKIRGHVVIKWAMHLSQVRRLALTVAFATYRVTCIA